MNVLMVEPGEVPYAVDIGEGLEALQTAVGGDIQAVYPYEDPVALICNDDGKYMGLPLNRALRDDEGNIYDIVAGNFFLCGLGEEDFTDLPADLMEKYRQQFEHPEQFVRIAGKPEDKGHDYGHGKYETLATAIIGLLLLCVGFGIFWNGASSIYTFLRGGQLESPGVVALVAALVSIVSKEILYQYTVIQGKKLNSQAVIANAWHHRSDALSSIGTAIGIGGAILLGDHWRVLDPVAAVVVSFFIMKVSVRLLIPCVDELLEKSLPEDVEKEIERLKKEEERLTKELARVNSMLGNERFISKAPKTKVDEERAKLERYTAMMEQVKERLAQLQ